MGASTSFEEANTPLNFEVENVEDANKKRKNIYHLLAIDGGKVNKTYRMNALFHVRAE